MSNPIHTTSHELPNPTTTKRQKLHHHTTEDHHRHHLTKADHNRHHHHHNDQSLLPGLPDDIAHLCLSRVPHSTLYSVCHSWRRLIYSPSFPPFLSLYALVLSTETKTHTSDTVQLASFDPVSHKWLPHPSPPPPPTDPGPAPQRRFLFRHPSYISRQMPIQSAAVAGNLVLLAATDDSFVPALAEPLVFNPVSGKWALGPRMVNPRRWCAAGGVAGSVYVASGIGSHYNNDVARSVEKWEICKENHHNQRPRRERWKWEKMGNLKNGRFSRDAIEAVGWRGKLCMVNNKGNAAKEGAIYDVQTDTWREMPEGMLSGWRGPAAAMDEETIYVVDESKGLLKKYDHAKDSWVNVAKNEMLKGAQQLAAAGGRVCALGGDGGGVTVVDVAPGRAWTVSAPAGSQVVAIHILPRMCHKDF